MTYSPKARRNIMATGANADLLTMLVITHEDLVVPARVINDNVSFAVAVNEGGVAVDIEFERCRFDVGFPDEVDQQTPQATVSVSNIGRKLTEWLEYSNGGAGAKLQILQMMRSDARQAWEFEPYAEPGVIDPGYVQEYDINDWNPWELDIEMDLTGIVVNNQVVSGRLGYESASKQAAVAVFYDPITSPGLF